MAKRKGRKWNVNNRVVAVASENGLTALVDQTVKTVAATIVSDEEYRAISVKLRWAIRNLTPGQGPIVVGISHGDYSATEIKEWIEATGAMIRGDMIQQERNARKIRKVGIFAGELAQESLNDGKPITTKLNWHIPVGKVVTMWGYNQSGATLTTGAVVVINGTIFLRWS